MKPRTLCPRCGGSGNAALSPSTPSRKACPACGGSGRKPESTALRDTAFERDNPDLAQALANASRWNPFARSLVGYARRFGKLTQPQEWAARKFLKAERGQK